jgi:hypothetical protein
VTEKKQEEEKEEKQGEEEEEKQEKGIENKDRAKQWPSDAHQKTPRTKSPCAQLEQNAALDLKVQTQKQPANTHELLPRHHPLQPPELTISLILDPSRSLRSSALFPSDDDGLLPNDDDGRFPSDDDGLLPVKLSLCFWELLDIADIGRTTRSAAAKPAAAAES